MTLTTIILLVIGVLCIIVSVASVSKEKEDTEESLTEGVQEELTEGDKEHLRKLVDDFIDEYGKIKAKDTSEAVDQLVAEKLQEIDEYFKQLNEETGRSKAEVNSIYSMVCDKQKEIKLTLTLVDEYKKRFEVLAEKMDALEEREAEKEADDSEEDIEQEKAEENGADKENESDEESETVTEEISEPESEEEPSESEEDISDTEEEPEAGSNDKEESEEEYVTADDEDDDIDYDEDYETKETLEEMLREEGIDIEGGSTEENVMGMYQAGFSILEIAKLLGIGVGEVKSIVDKHQGE